MNTAVHDRPAKPADKARANSQTARAAAISTTEGCPFCSRAGLPIMPLRYAVIPTWISERAKPVLAEEKTLNPRAPADALKKHRYALRTLRQGYVHVYFGVKGMWQIYAVTPDGLLRLIAKPDEPDAKAGQEMSAQCKREGHNIPASFIRIPEPYSSKLVWIAFSQDVWSKQVRTAYEKKPGERMQEVDCAKLSADPDACNDAFAITRDAKKLNQLVEEYALNSAEAEARRRYATEDKEKASLGKKQVAGKGQLPSVHGFYSRPDQLDATGKFAEDYEKQAAARKKHGKVAALALHDPVGVAQELNHSRLLTVQWRSSYVGNIAVARPRIISQAIMGLKAIYDQQALLAVAGENGITVVENDDAAKKITDKNKTVVAVDKLPDFAKKKDIVIEGMTDPYSGVTTPDYKTTLGKMAEARAKNQWARLQDRYDEDGRAKFEERYQKQMEAFQRDLESLGADYKAWAEQPAWVQCFADYDSTVDEEAARLTQMAAPILSGGPTDTQSYALWEKWVGKLAPNDDGNPVYAAYFGGRKSVTDYLVPKAEIKDFMKIPRGLAGDPQNPGPADTMPEIQKADKLYDTLKALVASDEGERLKEGAKNWGHKTAAYVAQSAVYQAAIAHIQSALAAATALLGNKLVAAQHAAAMRAHQAALYLYRGVEAVFIKASITLGQYLSALKSAGLDATQAARQALQKGVATVKGEGGKTVRALALAGILNVNDPKLRDLVIEVSLWLAGKGKELAEHFKNLGGEVKAVAEAGGKLAAGAAKVAAAKLRVAGITLSREAAQLASNALHGASISAERTMSFVRMAMGKMARIGGSQEVLLAGAALGFQSWAFLDASNQLKTKIGPEKAEAALSIFSAQVGMSAASVEVFGAALKALGVEKFVGGLLRFAGVVGAGASLVDAVSAGLTSARMLGKGDKNAAVYYGLATGAFFVGSGFGMYAAYMGLSALLGPMGIALLLVAIGVGLMFAGLCAEDTASEIWLDRCYWGKGKRKEDRKSAKWADSEHAVELAEMNSLVLGARAEIGFNDDFWTELRTGIDTVSMKVTLPSYDPKGSAFVLVASAIKVGSSNEAHLLYYVAQGKEAPPGLPAQAPDMSLQWEKTKGSDSVIAGTREIIQHFRVNTKRYQKVRISLDYWPDASDESAVLSIKKLEND